MLKRITLLLLTLTLVFGGLVTAHALDQEEVYTAMQEELLRYLNGEEGAMPLDTLSTQFNELGRYKKSPLFGYYTSLLRDAEAGDTSRLELYTRLLRLDADFCAMLPESGFPTVDEVEAYALGREAQAAGDWPAAIAYYEESIAVLDSTMRVMELLTAEPTATPTPVPTPTPAPLPQYTTSSSCVSVTLEIETSVKGKPFVLILKADGSLRSGWTNYEQTMMDGSWTVTDGNLVLDMAYPTTIVVNTDGNLTITVNYGQMGEKVYAMSAEQFAALTGTEVATPAGQDVTLEVETSIEGKPFVLDLRSDGTLRSGWTNYEQTMMDGSWTFEDGKFVLEMPYPTTIVVNTDGSLTITVNYGQMGERIYTMSAEQFASLR